MVFSGMTFLFVFLPLVTLLYFAVPQKYRAAKNAVLLVFSLLFYFVGEPKYLLLMLVSIFANYLFALLINNSKYKKLFLILSVIYNIAVIGVFKYTDFVIANVNGIFGSDLPLANIIMPIGISFFTLQSMSYVFDVYMGTVAVQKNLLSVATYIALFPQLVAGPIVRYETVAEELEKRQETVKKATEGVIRFIYGLSKKMIIANALGKAATEIFEMPADLRGTAIAWLGAIFYALHIFFDFGGYSDMAIGLGKVFGFTFLENFDYPYISKSITEFWRRWHISLGTWFRDYLYIPLGGNRHGKWRQVLNIAIVWALTGLWHGASWNFVIWGVYFAIILILEKFVLLKLLKKLPAFISHIYALILILIGWVIFNSADMAAVFEYIGNMFNVTAFSLSLDRCIYHLMQYKFELVCGVVLSIPLTKTVSAKLWDKTWFQVARRVLALVLLGVSVMYVAGTSFNPFIYFRF